MLLKFDFFCFVRRETTLFFGLRVTFWNLQERVGQWNEIVRDGSRCPRKDGEARKNPLFWTFFFALGRCTFHSFSK